MKRIRFLMCLAASLITFAGANAADLIVNGTSITLSGEFYYESVQIINGGMVIVKPYDGTFGTGTLVINADSIFVDSSSSIIANGAGYRGLLNNNGEGVGGGNGDSTVWDGGGGGGYGGAGGDGSFDYKPEVDGKGGASYGSADSMDIMMGSAGGAAGTADGDYGGFGGSGGGAISLIANNIDIAGVIAANGTDGTIYQYDASGGGSGGGILIIGDYLNITGTLTAEGGDGGTTPPVLDDGGGGGGGGRIKIFCYAGTISPSYSVAGGYGSLYGWDGEEGSYYIELMDLEVSVDIKPGSNSNSINPNSKGLIPVAILTTSTADGDLINFDADDVDPASIAFGPGGTAIAHAGGHFEDVDDDGDLDMVLHFSTKNAGIRAGDTQATLTGETYYGQLIEGSDRIKTVGKRR